MRIPVNEIKIDPGRRQAVPCDILELADSIWEIGLLNPITISRDHTLIAGLHRLEAAKQLGWTEIECTVTGLEGLQAGLAEIDENFVRCELTPIEYGDMLLRRKEIYEALYPESVQTNQVGPFRDNQHQTASGKMTGTTKAFAQDTAEKLGTSRRTVERQVQIAKNLTPEAKELIRGSGAFVTRKEALALSRLEPEKQTEAAGLLTSGKIQSVDEYAPPVRARPAAPGVTPEALTAELCGAASLANAPPIRLASLKRQMADAQDEVKKFANLLAELELVRRMIEHKNNSKPH